LVELRDHAQHAADLTIYDCDCHGEPREQLRCRAARVVLLSQQRLIAGKDVTRAPMLMNEPPHLGDVVFRAPSEPYWRRSKARLRHAHPVRTAHRRRCDVAHGGQDASCCGNVRL
jgi:hypothetical protein